MSGFVSAGGKRLTPRRVVVTLALSTAACALVALLAPLVGHSFELLGTDALRAGTPAHEILILRLEEIGEALLVGGALGGAGCALQALLRNPLAEPFTLGISSGASLAAVLAIRFGLERAFGFAGLGGAALVGAAGTLLVVWRLARIGKHLPPATLVLAGIAMSTFCSSAQMLIQSTSDFVELNHMVQWMFGSMETVRLVTVGYAALPIAAGLLVLL